MDNYKTPVTWKTLKAEQQPDWEENKTFKSKIDKKLITRNHS